LKPADARYPKLHDWTEADLADQIMHYWRSRGFPNIEACSVTVEERTKSGNLIHYAAVRSNLDGKGWPPR
jgi:hypothetical protein